jgi:hypothetical protein
LRWGIKELLKRVTAKNSQLDESKAKSMADTILKDPFISDSTFSSFRWLGFASAIQLASAIRLKELKLVLQEKFENFPVDELDRWFDSVMDRITQRFATLMRILTIILAVSFSFGLQLDSFRLVTQLSSSPEMRASLVKISDTIQDQAGDILNKSIPSIFVDAMKKLKESNEIPGTIPESGFKSFDDGEKWLRTQFEPNDSKVNSLVGEYEKLVKDAIPPSFDKLRGQALSIKEEFDKTKFQLIPDKFSWNNISLGWPVNETKRNLWGILASVALLSLGAPFWFNILRNLSNLKPFLSSKLLKEKVEDEQSSGS